MTWIALDPDDWTEAEAKDEALEARIRVAELVVEIAAHRNRCHEVPNIWVCQRCDLVLNTVSFDPATGQIGQPAVQALERCPNDDTEMRRQTWQENAEAGDRITDLLLDDRVHLRAILVSVRERHRPADRKNGCDSSMHVVCGFCCRRWPCPDIECLPDQLS